MNEYITPKYTKMARIEMLIQVRGKIGMVSSSLILKLSFLE